MNAGTTRPPAAARAGKAAAAHRFELLRQRFVAASGRGDHAAAAAAAEAVLALQPGHTAVLADLAFSQLRMGRHRQAHQTYLRLYRALGGRTQAGQTWLDGLAETCGWLGRMQDVRRYGCESLAQADARLRGAPSEPLAAAPPAFEPGRPERNLIAYTLFGANPRYCEPAVMNVRVAAELFPHWRCRVYLDDTVPADVRRRLREAGAQVVDMSGPAADGVHPLMWRFLVADDPDVSRFLVRDADSLLSEREQAAVQAWTASDRWFHHMRDYFTHTELVLAGLWGGCRGLLGPLRPRMQDWLARQPRVTRFADQVFLREQVWPTLRRSVLGHDDIFGFHGARPFPAHAPVRWQTARFHVGSNVGFKAIQGTSGKPDGASQPWAVHDEQGRQVCRHDSPVQGGRWTASLPFFVADPIEARRWTVRLLP